MYERLCKDSIIAKQPEGALGVIEKGGDEDRLYDGLANDNSATMVDLEEMARVRDPYLTQYLAELERDYGIDNSHLSEVDRRQALAAEVYKVAGVGSIDDMKEQLGLAGFADVQVHDNNPPVNPSTMMRDVFDEYCTDPMTAFCTDPMTAFSSQEDRGEYIVNGDIYDSQITFENVCSDPMTAFCTDEITAFCGRMNTSKVPVVYDPTKWFAKIFFVGGDITRDVYGNITEVGMIEIDEARRQEFRRIVLKYKPLDTFAAAMIRYVRVIPGEIWQNTPTTGDPLVQNTPTTGDEIVQNTPGS